MIFNDAQEHVELMGFLGLFEGPKEKIIAYIQPSSGWSKAQWQKVYDTLYNTYKMAVQSGSFSYWNPESPDTSLLNYLIKTTGIEQTKVQLFLNGLYNLAQRGTIDTGYWNAGQAAKIKTAKAAETTAAVQSFFSPVKTGLMAALPINQILMYAGLIGAGYLIIPKVIKARTRGQKK